MARVTVEDCILQIPNRFELVLLASQRARKIGSGVALTVSRDNDKNPVVALREIAQGTIGVRYLHNILIQSLQRRTNLEQTTEETQQSDDLLSEIDFSDDPAAEVESIKDEDSIEQSDLFMEEEVRQNNFCGWEESQVQD